MASSRVTDMSRRLYEKHPLQRMHSPSRTFSALVHAAGLLSFGYSYKYLIDHPTRMNDAYGWHLSLLTIVGLTFATVTFAMGLLADATKSPGLFAAKNAMSVAGTPLEILVCLLYWSIIAIDVNLIIPAWQERLTFANDFSFHGAPAVFLALDMLFFSPPWTIAATPALLLSAGIATAYWFWVHHCYAQNGFWPYPIFEVDTSLRFALFASSALVMTVSTMSLKALYTAVNGSHDDLSSRKTQ